MAIEDVATSASWGLRVDAIYVPEPSLVPSLLAGIAMLSVLKMRRQSPLR